ncbi:MAG: hypothetical protein KDD69_16760 [Bdellovibrionales bacterium]|nr:hypothetical protein [Bdellovibrionales bacterium]
MSLRITILSMLFSVLSGCAIVPQEPDYAGPVSRPSELEEYYDVSDSYQDYLEEVIAETEHYTVRRIEIDSLYGDVTVDYFQRAEKSDDLILVMPVLGGRNLFANYIAGYMASNGFDAAVIHRDSQFKRPENYDRVEELFRENVRKDRVAMDFFEREYGKVDFGSFGISRGAINAAITAGVDPRLKYNVLAIGGADVVNLFRDSKEDGIKRYRRRVMKAFHLTEAEFYGYLEATIRTDPKYLAKYIDARDTLLFLSVFDRSVPVKYGLKLKRRIGHPRTIFLASSHYTTLLFTEFVPLAPPFIPLDFIETEALTFYGDKFGRPKVTLRHMLYSTIQAPIQLVARVATLLWPGND